MAKRVDTRFEASENVSKVAAKAAGGVTGLNKSVKDAQKTWKSSTVAIGAAVAAIYGVSRAVGSLIQSYREQEQAETKLAAALKATGGMVGLTKNEMIAYAKELQSVTTFGDEALINAQALMTTFTQVGKEAFPTAIEAAADMSAMFGQDLQQSVIQLGTALNDPIAGIGRLRRIGISFTEEQKEQIRVLTETGDTMGAQTVILEELQREFGGVARAAGETATGAIDQLKHAISDLQQVGGGAITEFLEPWVRGFTDFVTKIAESLEKVRALRQAAEDLGIIEEKGTGALNDKTKALERQIDLNESLEERIRVLGEQEKNFLNKALGATKGIREKKEELERQQKVVRESIALLEEQIKAEEEAREASAKDREEAEKKAKAQEEENKYTNERIRIQTELIQQFAIIDEMEKLWGEDIDVTAEKQKALTSALKEMLKFGFDATGKGIQNILKLFGEWLDQGDEVEEKIIEPYEGVVAVLRDMNHAYIEVKSSIELAAEAAKKAAEEQEENLRALSIVLNGIISVGDQLISQSTKNREIALKNEYKTRKEKIESSIDDEKERAEKLKALDEEFEGRRAEMQTRAAIAEKRWGIFSAIIGAADAVINALQTKPFVPVGLAMAVVAAALGAAQVATIAAQPIPKFAGGARDFVVPPGYPDDSYPMMVESGERVTVESTAAGGAAMGPMQGDVYLDSRKVGKWFQHLLDDREIILAKGAYR